jgi:hypothetical protein
LLKFCGKLFTIYLALLAGAGSFFVFLKDILLQEDDTNGHPKIMLPSGLSGKGAL